MAAAISARLLFEGSARWLGGFTKPLPQVLWPFPYLG